MASTPPDIPRSRDVDVDEIIPGVWLGRWEPAHNADWLRAHGIHAVFNCTKNIAFHPIVPFQYRIPVDDNLQPAEIKNMTEWAPEIAFKILREYHAGRPILIHCHAGIQRSATACAFFLLVLTGLPLIDVLRHIRSRRAVVFTPRANFADSLRDFEAEIQAILQIQKHI